jgi:hypothetical protein
VRASVKLRYDGEYIYSYEATRQTLKRGGVKHKQTLSCCQLSSPSRCQRGHVVNYISSPYLLLLSPEK